MDNNTFLLNRLKLAEAIIENNETSITDVVSSLNAAELTDEQKKLVKDTIVDLFSEVANSKVKIDTFKTVINSIKSVNSVYLNNLLDLQVLNLYANKENGVETLYKILTEEITFDSEADEYSFYILLSNKAILSRDTDLIKLSIDKISK